MLFPKLVPEIVTRLAFGPLLGDMLLNVAVGLGVVSSSLLQLVNIVRNMIKVDVIRFFIDGIFTG